LSDSPRSIVEVMSPRSIIEALSDSPRSIIEALSPRSMHCLHGL
jgi:hypothetical protein